MVAILASSPTKELCREFPEPALYEKNGFLELLWQNWPEQARCLMIAAFPDAHGLNDEMTGYYCKAVVNSGLPVACFDLWDDRHPGLSWEEFQEYDVVFLAGGHVATEGEWFRFICLRELLEDYQGMVIGTSAGSMNMAEEVYAWPEEPGETELPYESLFFPGLGLAKTVVLPHYQKVKDGRLDGKLFVQEIAAGHSWGKRFYAIPDGSYVLAKDGKETVFGEAYLVSDGKVSKFCEEGTFRTVY